MNTKLLNIGIGVGMFGVGMYFVADLMGDKINRRSHERLNQRITVLKTWINIQNSEIKELKERLEKLEGK